MPASKPAPEPDSAPAATDDTQKKTPSSSAPAAAAAGAELTAEAEPDVPEGRQPAGVYEFTGTIPTLYLEVPLTAHPAYPEHPATDTTEAVPARPATVFDWPFTAPDDGRWKPSKKKPNTQPDNAPADPEE